MLWDFNIIIIFIFICLVYRCKCHLIMAEDPFKAPSDPFNAFDVIFNSLPDLMEFGNADERPGKNK